PAAVAAPPPPGTLHAERSALLRPPSPQLQFRGAFHRRPAPSYPTEEAGRQHNRTGDAGQPRFHPPHHFLHLAIRDASSTLFIRLIQAGVTWWAPPTSPLRWPTFPDTRRSGKSVRPSTPHPTGASSW